MTLNLADWIIVGIVLASCLLGFKRGLIKEALSLVNWAIALTVALSYRDALSMLLIDQIQTQSLRATVAFLILFTATIFVGALVNHIIGLLVRMSGLTLFDRFLGLGFGFSRGAVIVLVTLISISKVNAVEQNSWWAESTLIPPIMSVENWASSTGKVSVAWLVQFLSVS